MAKTAITIQSHGPPRPSHGRESGAAIRSGPANLALSGVAAGRCEVHGLNGRIHQPLRDRRGFARIEQPKQETRAQAGPAAIEPITENSTAAHEPHLDRSHRPAETPRGFLIGQSFQVAERERVAVMFGKTNRAPHA